MNREKILEVIFNSIDDLNSQLSVEEKIEKTKETVLFGSNGQLDSLGVINLLVGIEERLEDSGLEISLTDEIITAQQTDHLQTVGKFADHIFTLI